jgi:hypothetical protein
MTNQNIKATLQLANRSPKDENGWSTVSETCWTLVEDMPAELLEKDEANRKVRITESGHAVLTYS